MASDLEQRYLIDPIQVEVDRVDVQRIEEGGRLVNSLKPHPITVVPKIVMPTANSVAVRVTRGQAMRIEVATACALERFFLDHRSYPADLAALVPIYLTQIPADVIKGEPLRYETTLSGRYRLWSVGWNGQDEGGKIVWQPKTVRPDDRQGDWVWQYELAEPPPAPPEPK